MNKNRWSDIQLVTHRFPRLTSGRVRTEFQDQFVEQHVPTGISGGTEMHMGYCHPRRWHLEFSHLSNEDARAVETLYNEVGAEIPFEFEHDGRTHQCIFEERPRMNWTLVDGESVFESGSADLRDSHGDFDATP